MELMKKSLQEMSLYSEQSELVAIKVGNSTVNFAFFKTPQSSEFHLVSFDTREILNCDFANLTSFFSPHKKLDCIVCSVVPVLTEKLSYFRKLFNKMIFINSKTPTGLTLKIRNPESFGVDRLAATVAAYELLKKNIAVVDAGTATTITVVTKEGEILGGAIMPGVGTMNYCLHEKTASLPLVDLEKDAEPLGMDTHSAILSGIVLGTVHAIEGIIGDIERKINLNLEVVITGGYCEILSKYVHKRHLLNKHLVIEGMRLIYLKNIKN
ncbi:type III pantothenate kinase [Thermodesulfovibrio aggregans]|uniref:Type III pantothenate kinase n=2 Tax=Thermodesulfovibrio aggregans TaxID=86166 RepID=A0A0U9HYX1_9BACT|nr:type III pantothenate kinase [Thermodesulfovibrio aggregans]